MNHPLLKRATLEVSCRTHNTYFDRDFELVLEETSPRVFSLFGYAFDSQGRAIQRATLAEGLNPQDAYASFVKHLKESGENSLLDLDDENLLTLNQIKNM